MRRHYLFLFLATMFANPVLSQWSVGPSVGVTYNHHFLKYSKYKFYEYSGHYGPLMDLSVLYKFDDTTIDRTFIPPKRAQ